MKKLFGVLVLLVLFFLLFCSDSFSQKRIFPSNISFGEGELKLILRIELVNSETKTPLENALIFLSIGKNQIGEMSSNEMGVAIIFWRSFKDGKIHFPDELEVNIVKAGYDSVQFKISQYEVFQKNETSKISFFGVNTNWFKKMSDGEILNRITLKNYSVWKSNNQKYFGPSILEYSFSLNEKSR